MPTRPKPKPRTKKKSPLEKKISAEIEKKLRGKLGIPAGSALPKDIEKIVAQVAKETDLSATQRFVNKEAISTGKQFYRDASIKKVMDDRLSNALKGVKLVSQSSDLQKMIDENAKMLFAKKKALEDAGFSVEEAFQLILAEVSAKKAK